jgi:hypothetical protein
MKTERGLSQTMTPQETLFLTFAVTVIGSGFGTTIAGTFLKKRFDAQLETHKALLLRSGRIHERQVDALLVIHAKLDQALFYLQRAASAGKFAGETEQELLNSMGRCLAEASEKFLQNKLLVGNDLRGRLDEFFKAMLSAGMNLNLALDPMVQDGEPRAKLWDKAREISYKQVPSILEKIETEARKVIHG